MTFLAPALLAALPLAALPVIVHLIHLYRRRQVKWAAMMFLRAAQRMNKGLSRLRQVLILAFRVLALAALLFMIARPLAGGWLGLTGGAPDTVLVLLDRSASMEQGNLATGQSKRSAGLGQLERAIRDAVGTRSRLVLIDSALGQAVPLARAQALTDLPQTEATATAADLPALLQSALDYISTNHTGRTDVWLLSDLQRTDWDAASGRWNTLRAAYAALPGVRFHLLAYPEAAAEDLAVTVDRVTRHETAEKAELLLDLHLTRHAEHPEPVELPLRLVVNGAASVLKATLRENQLVLQAQAIPVDKAMKHGWGRVELPADACAANNVAYFVFDEPPPLRSVIVTDDPAEGGPWKAALSAQADPARQYAAAILPPARAPEIPWEETALLIWQAPLPPAESVLAHQLRDFAAAGHTLLFLPPEMPGAEAAFGLRWEKWEGEPGGKGPAPEWWRNDSDLLANTRDGAALPVGTLEISRHCAIGGEGVVLARLAGQAPLLLRSAQATQGNVYFLGTLASPGSSSLARDGVVLFALAQRALEEGARTLGKAQARTAAAGALGSDPSRWHTAESGAPAIPAAELPLRAGVVTDGPHWVALNRPATEDQPETLSTVAVTELFRGLDFHVITGSLEESRSLTNEIWRTFLVAMALALLAEALLSFPPRPILAAPTRFAEPQP